MERNSPFHPRQFKQTIRSITKIELSKEAKGRKKKNAYLREAGTTAAGPCRCRGRRHEGTPPPRRAPAARGAEAPGTWSSGRTGRRRAPRAPPAAAAGPASAGGRRPVGTTGAAKLTRAIQLIAREQRGEFELSLGTYPRGGGGGEREGGRGRRAGRHGFGGEEAGAGEDRWGRWWAAIRAGCWWSALCSLSAQAGRAWNHCDSAEHTQLSTLRPALRQASLLVLTQHSLIY